MGSQAAVRPFYPDLRAAMTSPADRGISSDHILGFARSLLSHRVGGRHKAPGGVQTSTMISLVVDLRFNVNPSRTVDRVEPVIGRPAGDGMTER